MAIGLIVRLTRPEVIQVLDSITFVVHSIVLEKYRYWKWNHPVAVCSVPLGSILVRDYNFTL